MGRTVARSDVPLIGSGSFYMIFDRVSSRSSLDHPNPLFFLSLIVFQAVSCLCSNSFLAVLSVKRQNFVGFRFLFLAQFRDNPLERSTSGCVLPPDVRRCARRRKQNPIKF